MATDLTPPSRIVEPRGGVHAALHGAARLLDGGGVEPWITDHPWSREEAEEVLQPASGKAIAAGLALAGLGAGVFLALRRAAAGAEEPGGEVLLWLWLAGFCGGGLALAWLGLRQRLARRRWGGATLRLLRFPCLLGERLEAELVRPPDAPRLPGLAARLSCVVEHVRHVPDHRARSVGRRRWRLERAVRWSETRRLPGWGASRVPIRFDLPPGGPEVVPTALSRAEPRYWDLEVWSLGAGLPFHAAWLVPVYARPGPAGGEGRSPEAEGAAV